MELYFVHLMNDVVADSEVPAGQENFGELADAVELIQRSFVHIYPQLSQQIEATFRDTDLVSSKFPKQLEPPFFVGIKASQPVIGVDFDGSTRSMIDLAHEYGHALQFVASEKKQIPPMYREIFAFLAEFALFQHMVDNDDPRADAIQSVLFEDNESYMHDNLDELHAASKDTTALYQYEWNYPVARYLAQWINSHLPVDQVAKLFESGETLLDLLDVDEILKSCSTLNTLPQLAPYDGNDGERAYAHLGAIAMLEVENWTDELETSIGEFYSIAKHALQQDRLLISLDVARRPNAYAIWSKEKITSSIQRQCSPFGTDITLQNQIAQHTNILVENPNPENLGMAQ